MKHASLFLTERVIKSHRIFRATRDNFEIAVFCYLQQIFKVLHFYMIIWFPFLFLMYKICPIRNMCLQVITYFFQIMKAFTSFQKLFFSVFHLLWKAVSYSQLDQ